MNILLREATGLLGLTATIIMSAMPNQALAQNTSQFVGDVDKGAKIFKKCKACHMVGKTAKNSTGPVLNNVIGRTAGTFPGYKYGKGMKAASEKGLVWDEEQIFKYLANPKKYLRAYLGQKKAKAKMKFKLKKEGQRKDVIAYLVSISGELETKLEMKKSDKLASAMAIAELPIQMAKPNQICIQNSFPKMLLLTAEAKSGKRQTKMLAQSGVLCVSTNKSDEGTVGVFENEDALEGCSRLAKAGKTEVLIKYAAFDNCAWK